MKTLVFCALNNISTDIITGEGIELPFGIKITNDNDFKKKLIWSGIEGAIGGIEYYNIFDVPILYKIENLDTNDENKDDILVDFLGECNLLLFDLWQIKDNAVDVQMGYLFYPFKMQSSLIETYTLSDLSKSFTHSNLISTTFTNFRGKSELVHFSNSEIKQISKFDKDRKTEKMSSLENQKTLISSSQQKITLSVIFIQLARSNNDLGIKITLCCTALECLFTTDSKELTHKTSERAALLIGNNLEERKKIYDEVKEIYNIRSQVLHGMAINKKNYNKIESISMNCDKLMRLIIKKIDDTPDLDKFYRNGTTNDKNETLDEYFLKKIFT